MNEEAKIRESVRRRYAEAAVRHGGCCGSEAGAEKDAITRDIYPRRELAGLPEDAVAASLGCGNPTALAELRPGEVVLDLGSGGGIDVLLSARRVGPDGRAYGLDMTDEMLELARRNQRMAGIENAEFLKGRIEDVPLPDDSVDVIISNCVINLSTDKERVLREAFRVLRRGGRLAVSDVVFQGELPDSVRRNIELWSGCLAGALHEHDYRARLAAAGFDSVDVEITRAYERDELCDLAGDSTGLAEVLAAAEAGRFCSAFVRGRKPEDAR